jgi:hypothetical protein
MPGTTRRSISLKGPTYEHLKLKAAEKDTSASGLVEDLVAEKLDALGVPEETVLEPRFQPKKKDTPRVTGSFRFTF